uniref:Uncharacterized protein n=1 Tax=Labrus bergylta TaxID=56723 RepID=A0A3Q3FFC3_9LABR
MIHLPIEQLNSLNSYSLSTCEEKLKGLVEYANQPTGKPIRTISDVLGEILLLYQRKSNVQNKIHGEQLARVQEEGQILRDDFKEMQDKLKALQEENKTLHESSKLAEQKKRSDMVPRRKGPRVPQYALSKENPHPAGGGPRLSRTQTPPRLQPYYRDNHRAYDSSDESDDHRQPSSQGLRTRQIESLAKDVERFDPNSPDANVDDYVTEIDQCLLDLPYASSREKLKLIWKTSTRTVRAFMGTLPDEVRQYYPALCRALREEYSVYTDSAAATLGAFSVVHKKHEAPREYYRRLRAAYFQGRKAPGLEEDEAFKALFTHNLHDSVRYDVAMHCRDRSLTMQEMKKYAQVAWETRLRPESRKPESSHSVLEITTPEVNSLALEGDELPCPKTITKPQYSGPPRPPGGQQSQRDEGWNKSQSKYRQPQRNHTRPRGNFRNDQHSRPKDRFGGRPYESAEGRNTNTEMVDMIRQCMTDVMTQMGTSHQPSAPLDRQRKPDSDPRTA